MFSALIAGCSAGIGFATAAAMARAPGAEWKAARAANMRPDLGMDVQLA